MSENQNNIEKKKLSKKSKIIIFILIGVLAIAAPISYSLIIMYQIKNPESIFKDSLEDISNATPIPVGEYEGVTNQANGPNDRTPMPEMSFDPNKTPIEADKFNQRILNVLLLGLDASVERYEVSNSFRTDTIMLLSINFSKNRVDAISIPRDSFVRIPLNEKESKERNGEIEVYDRINTAFGIGGSFKKGGFQKAMDTVSLLLGDIKVDYYVCVDMNVVKDIVDAIGGLWYNVDIDVEMNGRTVEKGYQKLDGQQVLDYSRVRKNYGGDIGRISRQQRIVLEIVKSLKKKNNIMRIPEVYQKVSNNVFTNLDIKQMAGLALFANNLDLSENVKAHTLKANFYNLKGKSMLALDHNYIADLVKKIYNKEIEPDVAMNRENLIEYGPPTMSPEPTPEIAPSPSPAAN